MSIIKHFSVDSIQFEFEIKKGCILMIFYGKRYLKYFKYERNTQYESEYPLTFPFLKHLQPIDPSFVTVTKPLSNKTGETFCEALK